MEIPKVHMWLGQDVRSLPRETLLDVIDHLSGEVARLREQRRSDRAFRDMIAEHQRTFRS